MKKNPTALSVIGSVLIANDLAEYGWIVLIVANGLWIMKHKRERNTDSLKLHGFYLINSIIAVIKGGLL